MRSARGNAPGRPHFDVAYEFDGVSNVEAIRDLRPALVLPDGSPRRNSQTFEYDDLYRLTRVRYGFGLPDAAPTDNGEIAWRYDRIGNLVSQYSDLHREEHGRSLLQLGTLSYGGKLGASGRDGRDSSEPGPHALSQLGVATNATLLSYDANGNVSQKDASTFTWDFKDRLVAVEDARMRSEYTYDYHHRRIVRRLIRKQVEGTNAPAPASGPAPELTFFVNPLFEVRPTAAPIKYVWNGSTRVARLTGSISWNPRVQRLRLAAGWNLAALAISAPDLLRQLSFEASPESTGLRLEAAYRWDLQTQNFVALISGDPGAAGDILWLKVASAGTVSLTGSVVDPNAPPVVTAAGFLSWPAFEPFPAGPSLPSNLAVWSFAAEEQRWWTQLPGMAGASRMPASLAPGEAIFVRPAAAATLSAPDPSLRVRYYHADHLGSAAVMTDAVGELVEETAYFPFGIPRHEERPRQTAEPYQFTGKERDAESGLHYFEARYLAGDLARFVSPDPAYAEPGRLEARRFHRLLDRPQALNLYAYAHNNPLAYTDPTGYDPTANDLEAGSKLTLPNSVLPQGSVLPWKTRAGRITVLAGHGLWARPDEIESKGGISYKATGSWEDPGFTVVPPGTTLTFYAYHGQNISDPLGNAIEGGKPHPDQFRVTYYPGDRIPNYTLTQPTGLEIHKTPGVDLVTVAQPTSLRELLRPGMGAVHWAACRETLEGWKNCVQVVKPDKAK